MVLRSRLALRLALPAALMLSLLVGVGPAAAKKWTSGQTASYVVRAADGPAYRVTFKVPRGLAVEIESGSELNVIGRKGSCLADTVGDAHLSGGTFAQALRHPGDHGDRVTRTGPGTGHVRWVEAQTTSLGKKSYELLALDPRLVKPGAARNDYYGFVVSDACVSRQRATDLVRSVVITP